MVQDLNLYNVLRTKFDDDQAKMIVEIMTNKIANHYEDKKDVLATRKDIYELEVKVTKNIWISQFVSTLAVIGTILAIIKFFN